MIVRTLFVRLTLVSAVMLMITACQPAPVSLSDADAQAFDAEVDEIVTNMITGLSDNNWSQYTRDFDAAMLEANDEATGYPNIYNGIIGVLGAYQSRTLAGVQDQGEWRSVIYDAAFENEPHVTMRVVFAIDDPDHKVSGLWFDSPKLRGQ